MRPRFTIDVDEWQRALCTAMIVGLTVTLLYNVLSFTVTTVKNGIVNSGTVLAQRAQRAMESLLAPIEDLVLNADELGAAALFERFPYPESVTLERKQTGIGQWTVKQIVVHGANLDVLRSVEINLDGGAGSDSVYVETPPARDSERVEFAPASLKTMTSSPVAGVFAMRAAGGSVWRHRVPVRCDDEREDDIPGGGGRRRPRPSPTPAAAPTAIASLPAGGTGGGETPTPAASSSAAPAGPVDEGQAELTALIDALPTLDAERKKHYTERIARERFDEGAVRNLLSDLARAKAAGAQIDADIVKVLGARHMRDRRSGGVHQPIHTASAAEVQQALAWRGRTAFLKEIDNAGTVSDGVRYILGQILTEGHGPSTSPSASPGASEAPAADTPSGRYDEAHFHTIWAQEQAWRDCMAIVDLIQKAYDVANQDSVTPGALNIPLLASRGHLEYAPSCSEPTMGGGFTMDAGTRRVRCTRHGSRALPWAERRSYEMHFNELERARILVRQQGRVKEAIGTLKSYLARNYGREENNLYAQANLGRLYFQERNYEAAMGILKTLADRYPKSVRFAYETAFCFYARTNEQLALDYVNQALKTRPGELDRTMDEESTPYDLYLLRDQAEWMHRHLAPVQVTAEGRRELPPVRYADFALKAPPEMNAKVCYDSLGKVRSLVPKIVAAVRAKTEFKQRMTRYEQTRASLATMKEYEKVQLLKTREALSYARRQLRELSLEALRAAKVLPMAEIRPCPGRGSFHLEGRPRLAVECTMHPGIRPAERIDVTPAPDAQETRIVDLVLQHALIATSPALSACVDRQRKILDNYRTDDLEVRIEKDGSLDDLVAGGKVTQAELRPAANEEYAIEAEGEAGVLECSLHYSLQRMTAKQDGVDLLDPTR